MSFLIDTDICSAHLKQQGGLTHRFLQYTGQIHLSVITMGELFAWGLRAKASPRRLPALLDFFKDVHVLEVTKEVSREFGTLRAAQLDRGEPMPAMDLLIAATAMVHGLTLVTHNGQDYANVPGLMMQDWLA